MKSITIFDYDVYLMKLFVIVITILSLIIFVLGSPITESYYFLHKDKNKGEKK